MGDTRSSGRALGALLATLLVMSACGRGAEPEDGGFPLEKAQSDPQIDEFTARDRCARKEHGRWHRSIGHCEAMASPERLEGVWITGFEVSQFVAGATTFAQAVGSRRKAHEIEIDGERVQRLAGHEAKGPFAQGYAISFVGRRTRDPVGVDCFGQATFTIVVDRLIAARYAGGETGAVHRISGAELEAEIARLRAIPVTVAVRHSGGWGQREAEAVARCRSHGNDQTPSHSSPPGNKSAL